MCFGKNRLDISLWNVHKFLQPTDYEQTKVAVEGTGKSLEEELVNAEENRVKVKASTDTDLTKKKHFASPKMNGDNSLECNEKLANRGKCSCPLMTSLQNEGQHEECDQLLAVSRELAGFWFRPRSAQ
jgi:hypothetical protein